MSITLENEPTVLEDEDLSDSWLRFDNIIVYRGDLEKGSLGNFDKLLGKMLRKASLDGVSPWVLGFKTKDGPICINLQAIQLVTGGITRPNE